MCKRGSEEMLLPDDDEPLKIGDQLLFCARYNTSGRMGWILGNSNVLEYIETGEERPDGYIWRWLAKHRNKKAAAATHDAASA